MKGFVVDASVALKWLIPEEHSEEAMRLLERFTGQELELHAPRLLRLEVANALTRYVARGVLKAEQMVHGFQILREIELTYHDEDWSLLEEALEASRRTGLTVYDGVYVALAKRLCTVLVTADRGLVRKVGDEVEVEGIEELRGG